MKRQFKGAGLAGTFLLALLAAPELSGGQKVVPAKKESGSGEIAWTTDVNKALALSKKDGRLVMVDFYTDWCGYCRRLDAEVYTDVHVQKLAKQFIMLKVNPEKDKRGAVLAQQMGVQGFPTIFFVNEKKHQIVGMTGYKPVSAFLADMRKALTVAKK